MASGMQRDPGGDDAARRRRRRRPWRWLAALGLASGWLALGLLAWRTAVNDPGQYSAGLGRDVDAQHAFLHRRLHDGEPLPMRTLLTHTFYGFSLVDSVLLAPGDDARRARAVAELRFLLERIDDDALRARYADTAVPHGVYYLGQRNLLLGALLSIDPEPRERDDREFHATSKLLFDAFAASPTAHLESYPQHVWPADNVVALYSLALHDRLYGSGYRTAVARWLDVTRRNLDPATGLMPYKIDPTTGDAVAPPRGVTLAYSLAFLSDLAPDFAGAQYGAFRRHFHDRCFGLLGVREYPRGRAGPTDVDSGPIVLGIGAGANGFALAAARAMGDERAFASLVLSAELLGAPVTWRGAKRYLLGSMPIADAMIAWGKTRVGWLEAESTAASRPVSPAGSPARHSVLALLAVAALVLAFPTRRLTRRPKRPVPAAPLRRAP